LQKYYRKPQNFGELPQPKTTPTFSSGCDYMISLGKPQLPAKFEVANPSRCRNIEREPANFGELP